MTQEFHISVTPVGQNDYLVRTEQVAPGVPLAEELVTWPVAEWLAAAGHLMNDPLRSVFQGDAIALNSLNLVALGQQLYNALFQGTLRDSWITAQGIAQNHQQVLRLRLGLKDTKLARLPWEVMHAGDRPIATGPYIAFSRYQSGIAAGSGLPSRNMPIPHEEGAIKVLMILASPTDQVRLDLLKQEAIRLQEELQRQSESGDTLPEIQLTVLEQPGREELTQALEQGRYNVLHYSGHSNLGANGGEIYLVSNRTGLTETLSGDDLAGLLVNNNIQMAVFNSCLGAYAANNVNVDSGERNLTESLVKRGIRGVLAMSERIPDDVALTLTQLFYRNLSQGYTVDLCVSRMRQGLITAYSAHQMYWALPTLYLQREFDGNLAGSSYAPQPVELLNDYDPNFAATPRTYSTTAFLDDVDIPLPIEETLLSTSSHNSSEVDWLGEDTWGDLVDEIEYDDPGYAEDFAFVSDLFRQLDNQKTSTTQPPLNAELVQASEENIPKTPQETELAGVDHSTQIWEEVAGAQTTTDKNQFIGNSLSLSQNTTSSKKRKLLPVIGVIATAAIAALIGFNWWQQHQQNSDLARISQLNQSNLPESHPLVNLKTDATGIVSAYANEKLSSGDLATGLLAAEELINRGDLNDAEAALNSIPQSQMGQPGVNFLKGRLAWQFVQIGDKKYSIDDARRYWETAVKAKPESPLYTNALGFAYYAEGNLNRANDSWFRALDTAIKEQKNSVANTSAITKKAISTNSLTAYAGLALGLYKTAQNLEGGKKDQYIDEAIQLRQMVMKEDPVNFRIGKLSQNWMWTEGEIKDWRELMKLQHQEEKFPDAK